MSEIEIIKSITFYGFAGAILLMAVLALVSRNILYTLLFSVILFFCSAGIFFMLGADYNAVVQILLYGTAIPVLLLFAISFTSKEEMKSVNLAFSPRFFIAFVSSCTLFMVLWYSAEFAIHLNEKMRFIFTNSKPEINSIESFMALSKGIYFDYCAAFIIFGILLMITVLGISVLNVIKEKKHG